MKLLRNPVVVGVLAVLAVVFVLHALWPQLKRIMPSRSGPNAVAAPAKMPAASGKTPAAPKATVATSAPAPVSAAAPGKLDQFVLGTNGPFWTETPRRNPFRSPNATNETGTNEIVTAAEKLTLTSVLRQTGNSVAVVNDRVVTEGDVVAGYRIEKIEADRIWVSGQNGREAVRFKADLITRTNDAQPVSEGGNPHPDPQ